jgi:hypothetical protein
MLTTVIIGNVARAAIVSRRERTRKRERRRALSMAVLDRNQMMDKIVDTVGVAPRVENDAKALTVAPKFTIVRSASH